jgi:hypothetical protein
MSSGITLWKDLTAIPANQPVRQPSAVADPQWPSTFGAMATRMPRAARLGVGPEADPQHPAFDHLVGTAGSVARPPLTGLSSKHQRWPSEPGFPDSGKKGCNVNERGTSNEVEECGCPANHLQRRGRRAEVHGRKDSGSSLRAFSATYDPLLPLRAPCLPRTAPSRAPFRHRLPPRSRPA